MQLVPQPLRRKRAAHDTPRLAVLDLGSTSFHLLVAETPADCDIRRIASERAMLLMGRELARDAGISRAFVSRAVEAARDLRAVAEEWKADEIVVVGTAALRDAPNGPDVTARLEAALGAPVHLLTGHEEARLIFEAIRARISLKSGATLGLDLGGGSLELAVGDADGVRYEATLPVGVARMQGELMENDPPTATELRALRQRVREALEPHLDAVRTLAPGRCVAVGGTARALAKLVLGDDRSPRGMLLSRARLGDLARRLAAASQEERLAMPGMNPQRANLLPIGAEIFATALSLLGMEGLTICDWGLREGVLLELGRARTED
jgi:exopolyphosphatase/guanosine-5'-triphosphate,3'-diphosphate pyrophosphatase